MAVLNMMLKGVISGGLLAYLISQTDLDGFGEAFAAIVPSFFVLAVGLFVISNGLGACQWFLLLRAQKLAINFRQAAVFYWIGVFFNNILLGNIGGDAMRIYDVRRLTGKTSGAAAATFMDRFVGLFSTCSLALVAYLAFSEVRVTGVLSVVASLWGGLVVLLTMGMSRRIGESFEGIIVRVLPTKMGKFVASLRRSIVVYRHKGGLLLAVWAISLAVQFARILVYWSAGLAVGLHIGLAYFISYQPVAGVIAALPISIGGLGVRENIFVELFGSAGAPESVALAMSILGYTAGILASLLGGIAFIVRRVQRADAVVDSQ